MEHNQQRFPISKGEEPTMPRKPQRRTRVGVVHECYEGDDTGLHDENEEEEFARGHRRSQGSGKPRDCRQPPESRNRLSQVSEANVLALVAAVNQLTAKLGSIDETMNRQMKMLERREEDMEEEKEEGEGEEDSEEEERPFRWGK
jgi:hypothetical protein